MSDEEIPGAAPAAGPPSLPPGQLVPVEVVDPGMFTGEVSLADGTILRLRVLVNSAARVDGARDPAGRPMYVIDSLIIPSVKEWAK